MAAIDYRLLETIKAAYQGEAIFRPSSIDRVIHCPGSVVLIARTPQTVALKRTTRWTLEGSAMHALAEKTLCGDTDLPERATDFAYTQDNQTVRINQQMADGVAAYVDTVSEHWRPGVIQHVEQKLSLAGLNSRDPLMAENAGTTDCVQLDYDEREIRIFDLKGGQGVMVDPRSSQLKNYALMALVSYPAPKDGWQQVRLHVSQPRAEREEERHKWAPPFEPHELARDFAGQLVGAMRRAVTQDAPLNPGPWCHWCPARQALTCPAIQDNAFNFSKNPFDHPPARHTANSLLGPLPERVFVGTVEEPTPKANDDRTVVLRPLSVLSSDDLATLLDRATLFETYIAGARHLAATLIQHGTKIPGWKLGYRTGKRRWIVDTDTLQQRLMEEGLTFETLLSVPKIKSVHQIELALKKLHRAVPKELYETPQGGIQLIPANSDKEALPSLFGPIDNVDDTDE